MFLQLRIVFYVSYRDPIVILNNLDSENFYTKKFFFTYDMVGITFKIITLEALKTRFFLKST